MEREYGFFSYNYLYFRSEPEIGVFLSYEKSHGKGTDVSFVGDLDVFSESGFLSKLSREERLYCETVSVEGSQMIVLCMKNVKSIVTIPNGCRVTFNDSRCLDIHGKVNIGRLINSLNLIRAYIKGNLVLDLEDNYIPFDNFLYARQLGASCEIYYLEGKDVKCVVTEGIPFLLNKECGCYIDWVCPLVYSFRDDSSYYIVNSTRLSLKATIEGFRLIGDGCCFVVGHCREFFGKVFLYSNELFNIVEL